VLRVTDVEQVKKAVRKLAAGRVLGGDSADVCLELEAMSGCQVHIAAGFGALGKAPLATAHDRLIWILDGHLEVHTAEGAVTDLATGESTVLRGGVPYQLVCPKLTLYLRVEPGGAA